VRQMTEESAQRPADLEIQIVGEVHCHVDGVMAIRAELKKLRTDRMA
jgi:hypothetical protein